ncbi:Diacylglycerol O-acyltransferase 1-1 [Astathelohania contejeani]|uniref:O-acyltransferase n=1 Tax=Astathelohania contejeani TaxID=164912 RepID=A0ABQ7HYW3_9MICR|nr:Diacylglycerol O-acyltransferase 1-1 [Thelohania contejeani]
MAYINKQNRFTNTHKTIREPTRVSLKGIGNLGILLSILSFFKLILTNYRKYGLLMRVPLMTIKKEEWYSFIAGLFIIFNKCLNVFIIDHIIYNGIINRFIVSIIFILHELLIFILNYKKIKHIYLSIWLLSISIIYSLKLLSFYFVRIAEKENINENKSINKKENINQTEKDDIIKDNNNSINESNNNIKGNIFNEKHLFFHFLYFLYAPTLCYQSEYPMLDKRRWSIIIRKFVFLILLIIAFLFVMDQCTVPLIYNLQESKGIFDFIENLLTLSFGTILLWLIFFLATFVLFLPILRELTLFGDGVFFCDWWNSTTVLEYWRLWNRPVHQWIVRHLYIPLQSRGWSKGWALAAVFIASGLIHEYIISSSLKMITGWAFAGMIGQIPMALIARWIGKSWLVHRFGNYMFWSTFCIIGQPLCILFYYRSILIQERCNIIKE